MNSLLARSGLKPEPGEA